MTSRANARLTPRLVAAVLFLAAATPSFAQQLPYAWPQTVSTASVQVLPSNTARKQVMFHNPSASATVAVCPAISRKDGANIPCIVGGAGSITLGPLGTAFLTGVGGNPAVPSAWNAIASAPGSPLSILEWE